MVVNIKNDTLRDTSSNLVDYICGYGEIGIHRGLVRGPVTIVEGQHFPLTPKIPCWRQHVGSSPTSRTIIDLD